MDLAVLDVQLLRLLRTFGHPRPVERMVEVGSRAGEHVVHYPSDVLAGALLGTVVGAWR